MEKHILGITINDISIDEAEHMCMELLQDDQVHFVVTPNPEICLYGIRDSDFQQVLNKASLSIPDGFGLKIGGVICGNIIKHVTTGVDLVERLLNNAVKNNYSVLILGAKQEIGQAFLDKYSQKHPDLSLHYINGGMFTEHGESDDTSLIEKINEISPDIICVSLGHPKQERFMLKNLHKLNCKLMIGSGGTIDYLSGKAKRPPKWIRAIGLGWLYRMFFESNEVKMQKNKKYKRKFDAVIGFPLQCIKWRLTR